MDLYDLSLEGLRYVKTIDVSDGKIRMSLATISSIKLKSAGKNAFKNISSKAKIKVPKSRKKVYKKLLKSKGQKKSVKIS